MIKCRSSFCFLYETLHSQLVIRNIGSQDLQRHGPFQLGILCEVDYPHPAGADLEMIS